MVLWYGGKLTTRCVGSGPPGRCLPRSPAIRAPPGATWYELRSDLNMVAYCVGLGGAWEKQSCELRPATATASGAA